jgi:hypothetical protein
MKKENSSHSLEEEKPKTPDEVTEINNNNEAVA